MKLSTEQLVAVLDDIKTRVQAGDSFEGNLAYSCMSESLGKGEWEVVGAYRVGNSEGQGGMHHFPVSEEQGEHNKG